VDEQDGPSKVERRSASEAPSWSALVRRTVGILLLGHGLILVVAGGAVVLARLLGLVFRAAAGSR
jgi:hypothetical protein